MSEGQRKSVLARVFGEFLLIFAGVIIALMADDARQDWEQRGATAAAVQLLLDDLVRDSVQLHLTLSAGVDAALATSTLIGSTDRSNLPQDSVSWAFRTHATMSPYLPVRATFDLLLDQDGLRHIGDLTLQSQIARYFEQVQGGVIANHEMFMRAYWDLGQKLASHTSPNAPTIDDALATPWNRIARRLTTPWDELRQDNELMTYVWHRHSSWLVLQNRLRNAIAQNVELRAAIAATLE